MQARLVPLLLAALSLAGCSSTLPPPAGLPTLDGPGPASALPTLALAGCELFHTFYTAPADGFAPFVPEGFQLKPADPAGTTTTVAVFASACNGTREMWAAVAVVPPAQYANRTLAFDSVVLQGFTTNATHLEAFRAFGLANRFARSTVNTLDSVLAGAARDETIQMGNSSASYTVRTIIQESHTAFDASDYRYWVQNGTGVSGYVRSRAAAATSVGEGVAIYSQQGDAGAPPVIAGLGHRVTGAGVLTQFVAV